MILSLNFSLQVSAMAYVSYNFLTGPYMDIQALCNSARRTLTSFEYTPELRAGVLLFLSNNPFFFFYSVLNEIPLKKKQNKTKSKLFLFGFNIN